MVLLLFAFVSFLAAAYFYNKPKNLSVSQTNSSPDTDWSTYRTVSHNFQFKYPSDFAFQTPAVYGLQEPIVSLISDKRPSGTNLLDRQFTVSWEARSKSDTGYCFIDDAGKPLTQTKTVNGTLFHYGTTSGAAAGNFYDSIIYRTDRNLPGNCYEINLTVHTADIGNYPPQSGIKQADQAQAFSVLSDILATFNFTQKPVSINK